MSAAPCPRPFRARAAVCAAALGAAAAFAACGPADAPRARPAAADLEFLVAAGDSTYWVSRGPRGVRVRASALFLARWGGRLHEVYVADEERAFDDGAWFSTQRVYRRDLVTGDSALVFADPTAPRLAARHAQRHPDARLLDEHERDEPADPDAAPGPPDDGDAGSDAPGASVTVALVAAHGPYLSVDHQIHVTPDGGSAADAGVAGSDDTGAAVDEHRQRVLDLRTGEEVGLDALFGAEAAAAVIGAGERALDSAVAALRPAARAAARARGLSAPDRDAARRALASLRALQLHPRKFGLAARGGGPAVAFVAVGPDADGAGVTLPLPPVAVPGAPPAWWRRDVAPTLFVGPGADDGAGAARWRDAAGRFEVRARVAGGRAALELVSWAPDGRAAPNGAAGADGPRPAPRAARGGAARGGAAPPPTDARPAPEAARRALPIARVPAPLVQLLPAPGDGAGRRALRRAFEESAFYDGLASSVARVAPVAPAPAPAAAGRAPRPGA